MSRTRINLSFTFHPGVLLTLNRRLVFGGSVIALGLIGKNLSAVKSELLKLTLRQSVYLV